MNPPTLSLLAWVALALGVAWFCKSKLDLSLGHLIKLIFEEFRALLSLKTTPEAINAGGLLIVFIVICVYFFSTGFRDFLDQPSGDNSDSLKFLELITFVGISCVYALFCVSFCKDKGAD